MQELSKAATNVMKKLAGVRESVFHHKPYSHPPLSCVSLQRCLSLVVGSHELKYFRIVRYPILPSMRRCIGRVTISYLFAIAGSDISMMRAAYLLFESQYAYH